MRFIQRGLLILFFGIVSCQHQENSIVYMPDLMYSPSFKAQEKGSVRMPVAGTIPTHFQPYPYPNDLMAAGEHLKNPLTVTHSVLERGKTVFNQICATCHGHDGQGHGSVVPPYPQPPSLTSEKLVGYHDGSIYHVISMGQNTMPSYASIVSAYDRWAVIHYVRVLQRSKHPSPQDLKAVAAQQ